DRGGTVAEAGHLGVVANRQALYAAAVAVSPPAAWAVLEYVRTQPRRRSAGVRLLCVGHGDVADRVRLPRPRCRHTSDRALERHGTSDGRVDRAAVPQLCDG